MEKPQKKPLTKEITNFTGRLTRINNGDMNSGFAKFTNSYGYDPFSKPMNLTWLELPTQVTGVSDVILDGKMRFGLGDPNAGPVLYAIGSTGNLYTIQTVSQSNSALDSVVGIASVKAGGATFQRGGALEFFGSNQKIYVGNDNTVNSINFDGSAEAVVGSAGSYVSNSQRPLAKFVGKLAFGNAQTIGMIDATGTVTSSVIGVSSALGNVYSELNPPLPVDTRVHDLATSPDNNYLLIAAANMDYEQVAPNNPPYLGNTVPADSKVFYWNGSDQTVTAATNVAANFLTTLRSYLQQNHLFASDSFGAGLFRDTAKILTLPNNKSPESHAVGVNGQFLYWSAPEKVLIQGEQRLVQTMYYYGALDQENPPGLWRVLRNTGSLPHGNIVQMPFNKVVSTAYSDVNITQSSVITAGVGTHYYSFLETTNNDIINASVMQLNKFHVPATGSGAPSRGVYETQNQLFSKKIGISQIRVYCEPTVTSNKFQLDIIGGDGNPATNGTFTYTYGDITDPSTGSLSVERINFNPGTQTLYSCGIRISNLGSTQMTIRKIEIDYTEEGK